MKRRVIYSLIIGALIALVVGVVFKYDPCQTAPAPVPAQGYYPAMCVAPTMYGWPLAFLGVSDILGVSFSASGALSFVADWFIWSVASLFVMYGIGKMRRTNV